MEVFLCMDIDELGFKGCCLVFCFVFFGMFVLVLFLKYDIEIFV